MKYVLRAAVGFEVSRLHPVSLGHDVFDREHLIQRLNAFPQAIAQFSTGFRWTPVESLTVDLAAGSKVTDDAPDFTATAGLTWTFGLENNDSK